MVEMSIGGLWKRDEAVRGGGGGGDVWSAWVK